MRWVPLCPHFTDEETEAKAVSEFTKASQLNPLFRVWKRKNQFEQVSQSLIHLTYNGVKDLKIYSPET